MSPRRSPRKKPLTDSITGIKTANIRKLAYRAGIEKLSSGTNEYGVDLVYEEIRGKIKAFLEKFLRLATHYMNAETDSRKPFSVNDFVAVVNRYSGNNGINEDGDCRGEDGDCRGEDGKQRPVKIFKPAERLSVPKNGLSLQKTCFFRLVQEILQDIGEYMTFSKEVKDVLQQYTEKYIIDIFKKAKDVADNEGTKTVLLRHLNTVSKISKNDHGF
jgi:histone H3/H4